VLLAMSAFFSGSETALFSLSRDRLRRFRQGSYVERVAAGLAGRPRALLVTILLGNMVVDVAFFALASGMAWDLGERFGAAWSGPAGVAGLLLVIVFGEVAPKTIASTGPVGVAKAAALPIDLLRRGFAPLVYVMDRWLIEPVTRIVTGRSGSRGGGLYLTAEELQALVELAGSDGTVSQQESEMVGEVLRLHQTRVREVMVHRTEMAMCEVGAPTAEVQEVFRRTKYKRLTVYEGSPDNVVGFVGTRGVFLTPERPLRELLEPVHFVPKQQTVERLLKVFRDKKIQVAVVVDEYGGTAGLVTLEDCVEEIIGDIEDEYDQPRAPVERISDREFILPGNLSMKAWDDYVRAELNVETEATTLGGFVTALLGRIPQVGDKCEYGNVRFTVLEVACRIRGGHCRLTRVRVEILEGAGGEEGAGGKAGGGAAWGGGPRGGGGAGRGAAGGRGGGGAA